MKSFEEQLFNLHAHNKEIDKFLNEVLTETEMQILIKVNVRYENIQTVINAIQVIYNNIHKLNEHDNLGQRILQLLSNILAKHVKQFDYYDNWRS